MIGAGIISNTDAQVDPRPAGPKGWPEGQAVQVSLLENIAGLGGHFIKWQSSILNY